MRILKGIGITVALSGLWITPAEPATETILHNFGCPPKGANPTAGVIRDSAGNLYGTTPVGGGADAGVVYKVDTTGHGKVLYSFTGGQDGAFPTGGVVADSSGNLYGATNSGGASGAGVVFKLDTASNETVLYSFTGGADGGYPSGGVILDSAGNMYGTASGGGASGSGVVFKLDSTGHESVVFSFTGGRYQGQPEGGVVRDSAGNLYGSTVAYLGTGIVYKISPAGRLTALWNIHGARQGADANAVSLDSAGNLYGTLYSGGSSNAGLIFKIDTTGQVTTLYNFTNASDGGFPKSAVIVDAAGNLYGTTNSGGASGAGVVYKLSTTGQETVLYTFTGGTDGSSPSAGVILDSAGNFYGTTTNGGVSRSFAGLGVVYKLDSKGHETVEYSFPASKDGGMPEAGLIPDSAGNFYGTTYSGGASNTGVVYKMDASGHETVLYSFTGGQTGGPDGGNPNAGLVRDSAGNLYGTTPYGGAAGFGAVYKIDTSSHETLLHSFIYGPTDGGNPQGGVVLDQAGNLYGTTVFGGASYFGTVYKIDTTGQETVLHNFTGGMTDGYYPNGGLTLDSAGNLYGTASEGGQVGGGVVFKIDTTGNYTVLYNFSDFSNGCHPEAGVILDPQGNLYGTASECGSVSLCYGVVYKVDTTGNETVLYTFTGGADGGGPAAGLVRDSAGNLYGTTNQGGNASAPGGDGVVYKVDTTGQETVLHTFTGGADGALPYGSLILDSGALYGTASVGGSRRTGVVFKLKP